MKNLLERSKNALMDTYVACQNELATNGKAYKPWFAGGMTVGAFLNMACVAMADNGINELSTTFTNKLTEIYTASFPVITIFAALMAAIAFVTRMTANQQKAAQATSWLIRIAIAYVGVNIIGLIMSTITTSLNNDWRTPNTAP